MGEYYKDKGGTTTGAQTKIQFENGIYNDSPQLFYAECMKHRKAREYCDSEILGYYCQQSGPAVDWLDSLGVFAPHLRYPIPGTYGEDWSIPRCYYMRTDIVKYLLKEYDKRVNRGDIEFALRTTVTDLIQEDRNIVGIRAKGKDGVKRDYRAGAVILCTGGFGSNLELLRKYIMCEKIGAKMVNLDHPICMGPYLGGVPNPKKPGRRIAHVNMTQYPGVIWVDLNGKRVVNEDAGEMNPEPKNALENAPDQTLMVILDQKIMDENPPILHRWVGVPERSWEWFKEKAEEGVIIFKADTIEELGTLMGIDPATLKGTVDTYNGYVAAGKDADFGRQELVYKIQNPPFYGIKTGVLTPVSSGGPAHNIRQQVIDESDKVIPGLYIAGEISGFQGFGTATFSMGNIIFGKLSGKMAAWDILYRRP
jgi:succinate dehydrogenase/fumarate reductase flavoprotein subunit